MARLRKSGSERREAPLGFASSKPVDGRPRGLHKPDDNRNQRSASSATGGSFERRIVVSSKGKPKVGVTYVLNETTDEALRKGTERHVWSRNGLVPRDKLKLKLTKLQHKALQTPSYLR